MSTSQKSSFSQTVDSEVVTTGPEEYPAFPLSFAQLRMWLLDQFETNNLVYYNVPVAVRLEGELNHEALRRALNAMVERHEPLRTIFGVEKNQPLQIIKPEATTDLPMVDLSQMPAPAREAEANRLMQEMALKPFDLKRDLMLRAQLFRLSTTEHILVICTHHIASDGWSMGVFFRELGEFYEAFCKGRAPVLPELAIQYADYAVWQRDWLQGDVLQGHLDYWKKQLASAPPLLEVPLDHPRPKVQTYTGTKQPLQISKPVLDALRGLSHLEGCTLFMTLLAAFQTLLARYTGVDDIVTGSPIANRTRKEIEGLVGCFINMIVLRSDLSGEPAFIEVLKRVRKVTLDAYAHQDLPFEKLVDELQPVRDQSYSPVFQILFILQNAGQNITKLGNVKASVFEIENGTTKGDLSLFLWEGADGLTGWIEYATDLYDPPTMERMAGHYQRLLEAIVANPSERISRFSFLSEAERRYLLYDLNQTQLAYPPMASVPQLIEARAELCPNAVAVVWNKHRLTYREINARANRIASHLRKLGAGPGVLVGICLERTADMVAALLGILKSGAAYVPLDPNYPKDRLAVILEDAQISILLTQSSLLAGLPAAQGKVVCLDKVDLHCESPENFNAGIQPSDLLYVLFTSGSTGRPKGVAIEHHSVIALIEWARTLFGNGELDGILFSTSICFDVSVFEVFVTLSLGGKMIVAENALSLPKLSAANEVTFVGGVPSAIAELVRSSGIPRSVRIINMAGEYSAQSLVDKLYQIPGIKKVYDMYGPTEDTVYSTFTLRTAGGEQRIGRVLANSQGYVLDAQRQLVPLGMPGELYLGGAGLARGYWRQPQLTAEKFIPNPFSAEPGARLYRTGDLVRYLPDGNLQYIGRIDHQIKIRGFRIELGEVESVLRTAPGVREVVVVARAQCGEKILVAYLAASKNPAPTIADLRAHLKQKLPEYMVPSAFVILPALPLTPNGKVDRKALPDPEPVKSGRTYVPPRDDLDRRLVKIWEDIFPVRPIGICDNFFELGGHSLLAVRLFMQMEEIVGKTLPLATLFQAPTIEALANLARQEGWESPWLCVVPIKPSGSRPPFYCVHGVGGNILEYLDLAKYMEPDQPFYGIQAIGLSGKHPWHKTVEEMAAHYVKEMRDFQPEGPYYLGGSSFGGVVAFEMAKRLTDQGQDVRLLAFFDTHAPGYPKFLPATSRLRAGINHFKFRCSLHWGNLMAVQGWDRAFYIWTKIKKYSYGRYLMLRRLRKQLHDRIEQIFWPTEIVATKQAGHEANDAYETGPYSGCATIFRASVQLGGTYFHPTLGWSDYIKGKLDVYETPGHHGSIVRDPRARVLAAQLTDALHKAQGTPGSDAPAHEAGSMPVVACPVKTPASCAYTRLVPVH